MRVYNFAFLCQDAPSGSPTAHLPDSRQELWYWLRRQNIEILHLSEIEARTFLQFRQRDLIHRKAARDRTAL